MFYKLGQDQALSDLGLSDPLEAAGLKRKGEGYFGITGPGTGAIMGTALGTSLGTGAHTLSHLLGIDLQKKTGLTLPQLVALSGLLGAGAGSLYGTTVKE
jgi:hypothetical protein